MALELLPSVYEFSRAAVSGGGDPVLRDEFDEMAQRLLQSIPAGAGVAPGSAYGLAAYRPHAVGEGVPADDADRIARAMDRSR
ncbi:hypothetical protein CG740_23420 [Streptomyces sp. CB01201]|nr:hypothetical protein CG740_23420 [Streptomyces sp. CB01201]